MPSIFRRFRHWLEDHNPFDELSVRSARRRLRESNSVYTKEQPAIQHIKGSDGHTQELISTIKPYQETLEELFDSTRDEIRAARCRIAVPVASLLK